MKHAFDRLDRVFMHLHNEEHDHVTGYNIELPVVHHHGDLAVVGLREWSNSLDYVPEVSRS